MNTYDYIEGQRAAMEGLPCPCDASEDMLRGYSVQYDWEECLSAMSENLIIRGSRDNNRSR